MGKHSISQKEQRELIAHLMRRAGFGATSNEIDELAYKSYDDIVQDLVYPENVSWMGDHLVRRFHYEHSGMMSLEGPACYWLYRMVTTDAPLEEKITLFWHGVFATGYPKVVHGKVLSSQVDMFRRKALGKFDYLLVELSKDPAMIVWLDNQENHKGSINENYGRELLELFSMGVGNYSEEDIKEAARSFTGWSIGNTEYMVMRSERDSDFPYGRISWHFEFNEDDHDYEGKTFLGQEGKFEGEDVIKIICEQESTAKFIARHMYSFFVEDEVPVSSWKDVPPKNPEAIEILAHAYFESDHSIAAMLTTLFKSDFFKSRSARYKRMKSPAELVVGVLRLSGQLDRPRREVGEHIVKMRYMGQYLHNPPSVEGWHEGDEWIETGSLMERINFASEQLGNSKMPGVRNMIQYVLNDHESQEMSESCLNAMGYFYVSETVKEVMKSISEDENLRDADLVNQMIRIIATSPDFQRC